MYDKLYEAWKKEKESIEIQRLPRNFYVEIAAFIKKMNQENRMLDKKTTKAILLSKEFSNVRIMLSKLLQDRYRKFLKKALDKRNVSKEDLTEEEKKLYSEVLLLPEVYKIFTKNILCGNLSNVGEGLKQTLRVLRFVQEIPAVVGSDMKTYGPFSAEDIATLPSENARILVEQRVAVDIDSN
jgi:DNA replication factor GINS